MMSLICVRSRGLLLTYAKVYLLQVCENFTLNCCALGGGSNLTSL